MQYTLIFSSSDCKFSTSCLKNYCQRIRRRGGWRLWGREAAPVCTALCPRITGAGGWLGRRFPQTCADPLAPDRNKILDVTGLFLALQQREGWGKACGGMEE